MALRYITILRGNEIVKASGTGSRTIRVFYKDGSRQLLTYDGDGIIDAETGERVISKAQYEFLREKERVRKLHESS